MKSGLKYWINVDEGNGDGYAYNANADDDADNGNSDDILVAMHNELPRGEHFPYCTGS